MALIKLGGGIVSISGAMGGNVYARNRSGNYIRANTKPINPNTTRQQAVRNAMSDLVNRWSNVLTAAQRAAWDLYGVNVAVLNRLGESVYLTGQNHYIRSNSALARLGLTIVDDGPTIFTLPDVDTTFAVAGSEATNELTVTFDNTEAWANEDDAYLLLHCGVPQNAARNFFNGPWRYAGRVDGDATTPPATGATIAAPFVMTSGQHIWVYGRIVRADGRISNPFRADFSAGA